MLNRIYKKLVEKIVWSATERYSSIAPKPIRLVWQNAAEQSAKFIEDYSDRAVLFHDTKKLWDFAINKAIETGLYIECGVFDGRSLNYMARLKPKIKFYGFDSFEGLEEDWYGHFKVKGSFDLKGELPIVEQNVELIKGWLVDTYLEFLAKKNQVISFLHIDTDTYSPAKLILEKSRPYLRKGSIVIFDELQGYPNWENGEFKALRETLSQADFEYIAFSNMQAVIRIKSENLAPTNG